MTKRRKNQIKIDNLPYFAHVLNDCLLEKGITQAELAIKSRNSTAKISRWVRGEMLPSSGDIKILSKLLGVGKDELSAHYLIDLVIRLDAKNLIDINSKKWSKLVHFLKRSWQLR